MSIKQEKKRELIASFQRAPGDTGSPEVQIALLTANILSISEHLKTHRKDFHCRRGLLQQVNGRRALLDYLKRTNPESYQAILAKLGLRR